MSELPSNCEIINTWNLPIAFIILKDYWNDLIFSLIFTDIVYLQKRTHLCISSHVFNATALQIYISIKVAVHQAKANPIWHLSFSHWVTKNLTFWVAFRSVWLCLMMISQKLHVTIEPIHTEYILVISSSVQMTINTFHVLTMLHLQK